MKIHANGRQGGVFNAAEAAWPENIQYALDSLKQEAQKLSDGSADRFHSGCINWKKRYYFKERKIRDLIFSGYAPCNLNCYYCTLGRTEYTEKNDIL